MSSVVVLYTMAFIGFGAIFGYAILYTILFGPKP